MDDLILYGGPGCGKSTAGIDWLMERVEEGSDVYRTAFVSFTNAAVDEGKERVSTRFGVSPDELPYCRTVHSLCKRAQDIGGDDWLADKHLKEFGESYGFDIARSKDGNEEGLAVGSSAGEDAPLLQVYDWMRHRLIADPAEGWKAYMEYDPDAQHRLSYARFVQCAADYPAWKVARSLYDMTDLLWEQVRHPVALPVSVAVTDESQDSSPLMWAAVDALFAEAEFRATLGDDDQAIYGFSGADPSLMNTRPARQKIKLSQSHRLPSEVVKVANRIISFNRNREPKALVPMREGGTVERISDLRQLDLTNRESWFLLVRNWKHLIQFTESLEFSGVPYAIHGNRYSPWSDKGPYRAARTILALSEGQSVSLGDLLSLSERTPASNSKKAGVWIHGAKARLAALAGEKPSSPVHFGNLAELGMTGEALERLVRQDFSLLAGKVSDRDLTAYEAARKAGTFGQPTRVQVGSIHSVKGKEADNVVLLLACTGAVYRSSYMSWRVEEENRVAYVAATRTKNRLYGLQPTPEPGLFPYEATGI